MKDSVQQQVEQTFADQTAPHLFGWYVVKKSQIALKSMVFRTPPQVAKTLPLHKLGQQWPCC